MTSNDLSTIRIEFEVKHHEIFRMNLDLAKWRILLGLALAAVPIVSLTYFFVLIGETKILLQLSPLFIGLPLVAVGGQVLRLHAQCRKFVAGLPDAQRRVEYIFPPEGDGYDRKFGHSFSYVAWQDLLRVNEKPGHFVFYLNRFEAGFVPKHAFHRSSDIPILRSILAAKLGVRARLFSQ